MTWQLMPLMPFMAAGLAVVCETLLGFRLLWRGRRWLAWLGIGLFAVSASWLVIAYPALTTAANALVAACSMFNLTRVIRSRSAENFLFRSVNTTGLWLACAHILIFSLIAARWQQPSLLAGLVAVLAVSQLALAIGLWLSAGKQIKVSNLSFDKAMQKPIATNHLPSITVAVPARNEGPRLAACLDAILASDYPKLEVIVLDDHSGDRTPEIVRGYAHAGVRFVRGDQPAPGWLPKNQAYDRLAKEASGKFILFCGVDVRLAPHSLQVLEAAMHTKRKSMMTILPQNRHLRYVPAIQAMRYYWETAPPRRLFRRPPVLSSCWMIERAELQKAGGFAASKQSIAPEAHFARHALRRRAYGFIRSNLALGVTTEKDAKDQRETAVYMRYPQLHRRPELVMLTSLAELLLLLGPLFTIPWALAAGFGWYDGVVLAAVSLASLLVNMTTFARVQRLIFPKASFSNACLAFLPAIASDIWLLNLSMYKYEFSEVIWKDRPVQEPVMQVIPHLPQLK